MESARRGLRIIERLAQLQQVAFAGELDAEPAAHVAAAAVAADHVLRGDFRDFAVQVFHLRGDRALSCVKETSSQP